MKNFVRGEVFRGVGDGVGGVGDGVGACEHMYKLQFAQFAMNILQQCSHVVHVLSWWQTCGVGAGVGACVGAGVGLSLHSLWPVSISVVCVALQSEQCVRPKEPVYLSTGQAVHDVTEFTPFAVCTFPLAL